MFPELGQKRLEIFKAFVQLVLKMVAQLRVSGFPILIASRSQ
jgi:hypothetical protein